MGGGCQHKEYGAIDRRIGVGKRRRQAGRMTIVRLRLTRSQDQPGSGKEQGEVRLRLNISKSLRIGGIQQEGGEMVTIGNGRVRTARASCSTRLQSVAYATICILC